MKIVSSTITMTRSKFLQILCLIALLPSSAFAWEKDKPATPPAIPPNPNNLPKVLLVGDSISSAYLQPVAKALEGKAVVAKSGDNANPRRSESSKSTAGSATPSGTSFTSTGACGTCMAGSMHLTTDHPQRMPNGSKPWSFA